MGKNEISILKIIAIAITVCLNFYIHQNVQDAQLSQRDLAAEYISSGRKWKTGTAYPNPNRNLTQP